MIKEFWQYVTTPVEHELAKKMGYLEEAIAMAARSKRCHLAWNQHYQYCRQVIVQAAERSVRYRTVLIFGAGSLEDLPLNYLSERFEKVILVDLVFLKSARRLAANFSNITLVEHDVTESLSWAEKGQTMVQMPCAWLNDPRVDLVVSLNIITQLPLIPVRWLLDRKLVSQVQADIMGKQIIFAHLHYLKQFPGEVCLIADRYDIEFNRQGEEVDRFDPWWDIEPPVAFKTWEWELMPLGEKSAEYGQKNLVGVSFL